MGWIAWRGFITAHDADLFVDVTVAADRTAHNTDLVAGELIAGITYCRAAAHDTDFISVFIHIGGEDSDTLAAVILYPPEAGNPDVWLAVDDGSAAWLGFCGHRFGF